MLADVLAGERPAGGTCPVTTVVILGGGEGDRPAGSPGVKVPAGRGRSEGLPPRSLKRTMGIRLRQIFGLIRQGGRATRQVVAKERTRKPRNHPTTRSGFVGARECRALSGLGEDWHRRRRNWARAADGLPGVVEDDMPRENGQRKHGTTRGSPRPAGTAKASPISCEAVKWRRACEWGGWGRLSEDGPGQNNPDRSEGPWGRATWIARMAVLDRVGVSDQERRVLVYDEETRKTDANQAT
jgi:hypothetical protein